MKHTHLFASVFAAALAVCAPASASVLGLPSGPQITTWDVFTGINSPGQAPTTASADYSASSFSSTMAAGMVLGGGQRLYSGSGATPNPFSFTVDATSAISLTDLSFVLKYTPTGSGAAADAAHFNITLNGAATGAPVLLGTSLEGSNNFQIYQWTWSGLTLNSGDAIQFSATSAAGHVSLDAVQIVPEPSSALLGSLFGALLITRRRR